MSRPSTRRGVVRDAFFPLIQALRDCAFLKISGSKMPVRKAGGELCDDPPSESLRFIVKVAYDVVQSWRSLGTPVNHFGRQ